MASQTYSNRAPNYRGEWEEEGLFWRGPVPPLPEDSNQGETWEESDWIEIPHEHYIPISKFRINEVLWRFPKVQKWRKEFKHFLTRIESIYHFHYYQLLEELKNDYEFFDPERGEVRRRGVTPEEIFYRERRFLSNFLMMMVRGNFLPFTKEEARHAEEYTYLFDLKVHVQWDLHDSEMLKNFFDFLNSDDPEAKELLEKLEIDNFEEYLNPHEDYRNRILIFWRGIKRDLRIETRILQKVNVLLTSLFRKLIKPFQRIIEIVRGERDLTKEITKVGHFVTFGFFDESNQRRNQFGEEERTVVFEKRWIRRLNMENQTRTIKDIFRPKRLQEPEFEKMVCLFRRKPKETLLEKVKKGLQKKREDEKKDLSIYLKMFKKIPLADSDLILPFKKPTIKSADLAILILVGLGTIISLVSSFKSGSGYSIFLAVFFFSILSKVGLGYFRTLRKYHAQMISELYDKNLDNDTGVLQYLIDSIEEQEYKEAVLAYYMLWLQDQPMTEKELDGAVEEFIKQYFDGIEVDFEVDDALHKIVIRPGRRDKHHLPLVEEFEKNGVTYYKALPLTEALEIMDAKWEQLNEDRLKDIAQL